LTLYNSSPFLRESIESVLEQTFRDFEFVVIDDASTDDSLNIINTYNDERIVVYRNNCNKGIIGTRKNCHIFHKNRHFRALKV